MANLPDVYVWDGSKLHLKEPCMRSVVNCIGVIGYHNNQLEIRQGESPDILARFDEMNPKYLHLLDVTGNRIGGKEISKTYTGVLVDEFKEMAANLTHYKELTTPVFPKGTTGYSLIWSNNLDRFYNGTRGQKMLALKAMADQMDLTVALHTLSLEVMVYYNTLKDSQTTQHGEFGGLTGDTIAINAAVEACYLQGERDLGWFKFADFDQLNFVELINAWFPIDLIKPAVHKFEYTHGVPIKSFDKVCIHIPKAGEKYKITVVGGPIQFCSSYDSKHPCTAGFTVAEGEPIIIDPSQLGNLLWKYIMVTNLSLTVASHYIFEIVKP